MLCVVVGTNRLETSETYRLCHGERSSTRVDRSSAVGYKTSMNFRNSLCSCVVLVAALTGCKSGGSSPAQEVEGSATETTEAAATEKTNQTGPKTIEIQGRRPAEGLPAPSNVAAPPQGAQGSESGLAWIVLKRGDGGDHPAAWDQVIVNYTAWRTDGEMFDSSMPGGEPATLSLHRVIRGWAEGVQLMTRGEKRRFWIPGSLAYGEDIEGSPRNAFGPPLGTLVFDVEFIDFVEGPKPSPTPEDVAAMPPNAEKTKSGLGSRILAKGTGTRHPGAAGKVAVHYTGWTTDGKMFDSSVPRGEPATVSLDHAIPGWTEGVQLMVEGEKRRLWIPSELGYARGSGHPQGMLVFDLELIEILE